MYSELYHHGVKGMHWGVRLGPPYPLNKQGQAVADLYKKMGSIGYKEFDGLMTPEQVAREKRGSCHDQVVYEYSELKKAGLNPKTKFFIEADDNGNGGTTHSLVYFEFGKKIWWLENAWEDQKGLRSYASEAALVKDVFRRWDKNNTYTNLYSGNLPMNKLTAGMDLGELLDVVEFD